MPSVVAANRLSPQHATSVRDPQAAEVRSPSHGSRQDEQFVGAPSVVPIRPNAVTARLAPPLEGGVRVGASAGHRPAPEQRSRRVADSNPPVVGIGRDISVFGVAGWQTTPDGRRSPSVSMYPPLSFANDDGQIVYSATRMLVDIDPSSWPQCGTRVQMRGTIELAERGAGQERGTYAVMSRADLVSGASTSSGTSARRVRDAVTLSGTVRQAQAPLIADSSTGRRSFCWVLALDQPLELNLEPDVSASPNGSSRTVASHEVHFDAERLVSGQHMTLCGQINGLRKGNRVHIVLLNVRAME